MKMAALLADAALALAWSSGALAQSDDVAYCSRLSDRYNTYVLTQGSRGSLRPPPADIAAAMSKCPTRDVKSAIPVLEQALKNARIDLPPLS